ncbi:hypothetical protein GALL_541740 [mine drainage metagenome]|uniref:Uncharacterized protein n=1 Tax=mine drainage metagenome TaxID=410659 RepID=A0A1J5P9W2_9ZZZZ
MLSIVPQAGDRVAVEIAHHLAFGAEGAGAARGASAGKLREEVRRAVVIGLLLGRIGMALIGRVRLCAIEAERIGGVAAVGGVGEVAVIVEQIRIRGQIIHRRRVAVRLEDGLARGIGRIRVGREVVVKRPVLVEDDHEMLDRGRGPRLVLRATMMAVVVVPTEIRTAAIQIISGNWTAPANSSRDAKHRDSGK